MKYKEMPEEPTEEMIDHAITACKATNVEVAGKLSDPQTKERALLRAAYVAMWNTNKAIALGDENKKLFHVTYFYLATGMEGKADARDLGIVESFSPEEAIAKIAKQEYPTSEIGRRWFKGCLTAKEVR